MGSSKRSSDRQAVDSKASDSFAVEAWPGLDLGSLFGPGFSLGKARRFTTQTSTFDAADHRLARSGVMVDVAEGCWTVRCANLGEREFASADGEVPVELREALSGVARGAELVLAVRVKRSGRVIPVATDPPSSPADGAADDGTVGDADDGTVGDASGSDVGRIIDEDVSVLDGRRVVSRQRYVSVEGEPHLVAHARRRLAAIGMADRVLASADHRSPLGPPDPVPWPLEDRPVAATIVQRALARSLARMLAHDPVVRLDLHVEGVHQMRVATRRLRSDLRTFAELLGPLPEDLSEDLRWLAAVLGEVRDPDVLRKRLVDSIARLEPADRKLTNSLVRRLVRERDAALERLHQALDTTRYHGLVAALVELAEQPPLVDDASRPAADVLRPAARRAWKRLRKAARAALKAGASVEEVHETRIRAKRFRYALDAMADVVPAARAHAERLAVLQDVLGDFNDAVVAEEWLRRAAAHEEDPRRTFVLGQLVMAERAVVESGRATWPDAWRPVRRPKVRAWLER